MKLDKKDKRILYELDKNARQPLSKIAKKVNLSRESILYRINKYKKEKLLRNYVTVIDASKLGIHYAKVYVKLNNTTEEKEIIQALKTNQKISWIGQTDGKYNIIYGPKYETLQDLNVTIQEITNQFSESISQQEISLIINASHFYRDYLIEQKGTTERKIQWGTSTKKTIELDNTDKNILRLICEDSRMTAVEIANKTELSADAIIHRIKQLQKRGIIEHYMIWPNASKLIGEYYKILIKLNTITEEQEKQLKTYCLEQPNIVYYVRTMGSWQVELDIEVKNPEQLRQIIRELTNTFPLIKDITQLNIYDEHKFLFYE